MIEKSVQETWGQGWKKLQPLEASATVSLLDIQEHVQQQACRTVHIHPSPAARPGLRCEAQEGTGGLRFALTRCSLDYTCISEYLNNNLPDLRYFFPLSFAVQFWAIVFRSSVL